MQKRLKMLDSSLFEEQVLWPVQTDYQLILPTKGMLIDQKSCQTLIIWPGISEKPRAEVVWYLLF